MDRALARAVAGAVVTYKATMVTYLVGDYSLTLCR
jgi:hypothetical protein